MQHNFEGRKFIKDELVEFPDGQRKFILGDVEHTGSGLHFYYINEYDKRGMRIEVYETDIIKCPQPNKK